MRDSVSNFYADANRSGALLWDLLIDYDRAQDVPGMVLPTPPFWAKRAPYGSYDVARVVEVVEGPPDVDRLYTILTARLARSGYMVDAFDFRDSTSGWHLKIRLDSHPSPLEAVALQAICGSDPSRESCNLQRARGVEQWAREVEQDGTGIGHAAAEFWRTRWNVLYQPNPTRKGKPMRNDK